MKSLFPIVIEAAQLLGTDATLVTQLQAAIPKILDFPRTTRNKPDACFGSQLDAERRRSTTSRTSTSSRCSPTT